MFTRLLRSIMTSEAVAKVPIPARGVDYRGKVLLAPMVRSGELPSRLVALSYGADLVWGTFVVIVVVLSLRGGAEKLTGGPVPF